MNDVSLSGGNRARVCCSTLDNRNIARDFVSGCRSLFCHPKSNVGSIFEIKVGQFRCKGVVFNRYGRCRRSLRTVVFEPVCLPSRRLGRPESHLFVIDCFSLCDRSYDDRDMSSIVRGSESTILEFSSRLLFGFDTNAPGITPDDFVMISCTMLTPSPTGVDRTIGSSNQTEAINHGLITTRSRCRCSSTTDHNYLTNINEICIFDIGVEFHQCGDSGTIFSCDPGECISFLYRVSGICHGLHPPFNHCATNQSLDGVGNSTTVIISNAINDVGRLLDLTDIFAQVAEARRDKTLNLGVV